MRKVQKKAQNSQTTILSFFLYLTHFYGQCFDYWFITLFWSKVYRDVVSL